MVRSGAGPCAERNTDATISGGRLHQGMWHGPEAVWHSQRHGRSRRSSHRHRHRRHAARQPRPGVRRQCRRRAGGARGRRPRGPDHRSQLSPSPAPSSRACCPRRSRSSSRMGPSSGRWVAARWRVACSRGTRRGGSSNRPGPSATTAQSCSIAETEGHVVAESLDWNHPHRRRYWERHRHFIGHAAPLERRSPRIPSR